MNILLVADNIVSSALVIVCWWLAHQNSGGRQPFKRAIATGYSLLAMTVLASMMILSVSDLRWLVPYAELAGRTVLTVTLGAVAVRLAVLHSPPPDH
ncbi:hypothetical protein GN241_10980 [Rhodobacteraceae bacterium IMCC1335]